MPALRRPEPPHEPGGSTQLPDRPRIETGLASDGRRVLVWTAPNSTHPSALTALDRAGRVLWRRSYQGSSELPTLIDAERVALHGKQWTVLDAGTG